VASMCTSKRLREEGRCPDECKGFSIIELILGLALTVCLAVAVAPLWLSLQGTGVREGDRTVRLLQARVAVARFERDLRLASAAGCPFSLTAPILEASSSQVVFLEQPALGVTPILVEWEIVNGSLMRRRGACPVGRPVVFSHSLFVDHKTMLEGVRPGSVLGYLEGNVGVDLSGSVVDLAPVDGVVLELMTSTEGANASVLIRAQARVGR
jgi:type II secretory pathway pseudopilin PulG